MNTETLHPLLSSLPQNRYVEPRLTIRRARGGEALCHLRSESHLALVRDVSPGGVGMWLRCPLEPGSRLSIELLEPAREERPAEVVHCHGMGDGTWLVGCRFKPPADPT